MVTNSKNSKKPEYPKKPSLAVRPRAGRTEAIPESARAGWRELETTKAGAEEGEELDLGKPISERLWFKARSVITQWIGLKVLQPNITGEEAAQRIGVSRRSLQRYVQLAAKEGWLKYEDPLLRLEHEVAPKIVDNLNFWLDKQDKAVTIEAAKGTLFKAYQEFKGISDSQKTVLALKIEMPDGKETPLITGQVFGKPRVIDHE